MASHEPAENEGNGLADAEARAKMIRVIVFVALCAALAVTLWALISGADRNLYRSPTAVLQLVGLILW